MDASDLQAGGLVFVLFFPTSVFLWSILLIGSGFVRDIPAMPWELQLSAHIAGADRSEGSSPMAVPIALLCLALFNVVPLGLLVRPYGPVSWVAAVVYVVVQSLWLLRIRRAGQRINRQ